MGKEMKCSSCGKEVDRVCSICWRCKDCALDCHEHMQRTTDGAIECSKKVKKSK